MSYVRSQESVNPGRELCDFTNWAHSIDTLIHCTVVRAGEWSLKTASNPQNFPGRRILVINLPKLFHSVMLIMHYASVRGSPEGKILTQTHVRANLSDERQRISAIRFSLRRKM